MPPLAGPARSATGKPCDFCIVRSLNLCGALDDDRLALLLALGGQRKWNKGEVLFREGDPMGSFFKITRGVVSVSRTLDDARRQIVALRAPGDCCGYLESDGKYAFQGEALTDVEACAFDRRRFDSLVKLHPDLATALAETLSAALAQGGRNMLVMGKLRSTERVANFLCEIAALYGVRQGSVKPFTLNMRRGEIGDYLGLALETVSRSFAALQERKLIALARGEAVAILDYDRLAEIGKFEPADRAAGRSTMLAGQTSVQQTQESEMITDPGRGARAAEALLGVPRER